MVVRSHEFQGSHQGEWEMDLAGQVNKVKESHALVSYLGLQRDGVEEVPSGCTDFASPCLDWIQLIRAKRTTVLLSGRRIFQVFLLLRNYGDENEGETSRMSRSSSAHVDDVTAVAPPLLEPRRRIHHVIPIKIDSPTTFNRSELLSFCEIQLLEQVSR